VFTDVSRETTVSIFSITQVKKSLYLDFLSYGWVKTIDVPVVPGHTLLSQNLVFCVPFFKFIF
jgi:hypothetical protein